jgi:hypothetical protein
MMKIPTKIPTVAAKKPAPKAISPVENKPATPAIVQQAGPAIPPDIAKRLQALEKELSEAKAANVTLQEKIAKKQEDKNAWKEKIYPISDVETWAKGGNDSPVASDDWRMQYHEKFAIVYTFEINKDDAIIPRLDLPPRLALCLLPTTALPVEPGETGADNRMGRLSGMIAYFDDFAYENGQISGVRGVPHRIGQETFEACFVSMLEDEAPSVAEESTPEPEQPEATPEPPPVAATPTPAKLPKSKK